MTNRKLDWRPTLAAALVASVLIVVSCEAPRPEPLAPGANQKSNPASVSATDVLFEYQVEKPVTRAADSGSPRYPKLLRDAGVEGEVLASFVVDENGTADVATLKFVRSTHELFSTAVKNALPTMRFTPAEVGGKKVRQLVQQPFSFKLPVRQEGAPREGSAVNQLEAVGVGGKTLAFTLRRPDALADVPNIVVYTFDGKELARSERDTALLRKIAPASIHSIEVFKPRSCPATMTCPMIKIRLAKGQALGASTLVRPMQDGNTSETRATEAAKSVAFRVNRSDYLSSPMNIEVLSSSGEVLARYGSRAALNGKMNSEDIAASETYSGTSCKAGTSCPLTRIWIKPGREAAYRKQ